MRRGASFFALFCSLAIAQARTDQQVNLASGTPAKITVGSCFDQVPPCGFAPIDVTITNFSATALSWRFNFASPAYSYRSGQTSFAADLIAPAAATRTFKLLVPLAVAESQFYNAHLAVTVSGPGTEENSFVVFTTERKVPKPSSPFIAMSEALAARCWTDLASELKGSNDLSGGKFLPQEFPEDWRALCGIEAIWIKANELAAFSVGQRQSVQEWIARGGSLFLLGTETVPTELEASDLGKIVPVANEEPNASSIAAAILALEPTLPAHLNRHYIASWDARKIVGELVPNLPLLLSFMIVFGILAGPINLFVFARPGRRHRLFWTTPLISIGASVLLFVLIIVQDGFGGSGARFALVRLSPRTKRSATLQEQIARTGLIRSSAFETRDSVFAAPISLYERENASTPELQIYDKHFGGDWFKSRSLQAQWLESVSSSRAEVALLNETETHNAKAAPIILSSIGSTLDELYFLDDDAQWWHATNVRTGEKNSLAKSTAPPELLPKECGTRLRRLWERAKNLRGNFYATTNDPAALIDTLPSIRWQRQQVVFCGPITAAAAP